MMRRNLDIKNIRILFIQRKCFNPVPSEKKNINVLKSIVIINKTIIKNKIKQNR